MVVGNGLQQASYQLHQEMGERFIRCQIIDEYREKRMVQPRLHCNRMKGSDV